MREESEAYVIHSGEGYVGGSNHERHKPVSKSANHNWYHYKEDYYKGVGSNDDVIDLIITQEGARLG